jgi:hypothetical protein
MNINLQSDAADVQKLVRDALSRYAQSAARVPEPVRKHKLLSAIELTFSYDEGAHVALNLDTRETYHPDGTWTKPNAAVLDRPTWEALAQAEHPVEFILPDGSTRTVPPDIDEPDYAALFGDLLKAVLLALKAEGAFANLPRHPRCELGVQDFEGHYGWPHYEKRGQDNLV